jgi:uncharacterized protein YdaU (DUF1376 family)
MAEFPVLPVFTDALIADTIDFTATQFGAYFLLMMTAWRTKENALPDNDVKLARWARLDRRTWMKNKTDIMEKWNLGDDQFWRQGRLDDERNYAVQLRNKNAEAGRASALKRKGRHSTSVPTKRQPNLNPLPLPSPSISITRVIDITFTAFWTAYPKHVAKQSAIKAYQAALKKGISPDVISAGALRYAKHVEGKDTKYIAHPSTWLNAGRWEDELPTEPKKPSLLQQACGGW